MYIFHMIMEATEKGGGQTKKDFFCSTSFFSVSSRPLKKCLASDIYILTFLYVTNKVYLHIIYIYIYIY